MSASFLPTYDLLKDIYGPLITVPEAAKIVNNHVSTWYKWVTDDELPIPSVMIGRSRRFRLLDLCDYIDSQAAASVAAPPKREPTKKRGRPCKVDAATLITSTSHA